MIIKKGYYVINATTLAVASGPDAIATPDEAAAKWQEIKQSTPGSDKFFVMWSLGDNFAWGE
jgi:hypothetical protein